jgi:hypothetical protein
MGGFANASPESLSPSTTWHPILVILQVRLEAQRLRGRSRLRTVNKALALDPALSGPDLGRYDYPLDYHDAESSTASPF